MVVGDQGHRDIEEAPRQGVQGAEALPPPQGEAGAEPRRRQHCKGEQQAGKDGHIHHKGPVHPPGQQGGRHTDEGQQGQIGQRLPPFQRAGPRGEAQAAAQVGHLPVPAHIPPQPHQQVQKGQDAQPARQIVRSAHLEAQPQQEQHLQGGESEVGQGPDHQRGAVPGKGEGRRPHRGPQGGAQGQKHRSRSPLPQGLDQGLSRPALSQQGPPQGRPQQQAGQPTQGGQQHPRSPLVHRNPSSPNSACLMRFTYRRDT